MNTQYLYAWAAGLLDADGTVTIKRQKRFSDWYYVPMVKLAQVATFKGKANVERLKELFGGSIKTEIVRKGGANKKDTEILIWMTTSRTAGECAKKVIPFMAGKVRQMSLILEFVEKFHGKDYKFHRISEQEREERAQFFHRMRAFQEKGFSPTTTKREDA